MKNSLVTLTGDNDGSKCGYCHSNSDSSFSTGLWAFQMDPRVYQDLIDRGWRRSGQYLYKPNIATTCCPAYTIRLDAVRFTLSNGNKKAIKKVRSLLKKTAPDSNLPATLNSGDKTHATEADMKNNHNHDNTDDIQMTNADDYIGAKYAQTPIEMHGLDLLEMHHQNITSTENPSNPLSSTLEPNATTQSPIKKQAWKKQPKIAKNTPVDVTSLIKDAEKCPLVSGTNTWEVRLVRAEFERDTFELYQKYQVGVHGDLAEDVTEEKFTRFLVDSPLTFIPASEIVPPETQKQTVNHLTTFQGYGTFHQKYYLNSRLIAISILDILPSCVSAVYFIYDPTQPVVRNLSMGVYSALRELAMAREFSEYVDGLRYYYMGFYIHTCGKMRYKAQFRPSDLACPKTYEWVPVEKCVKLLDVNKVALLSYCLTHDDIPREGDISVYGGAAIASEYPVSVVDVLQLLVLYQGRVSVLQRMPVNIARKYVAELTAFVKLVGLDIAKTLIFVVQ